MKLTVILVIFLSIQANTLVHGQLTINASNAKLVNVFKQIEKQSGYSFLYRQELVESAGKVTLKLKDATLSQALDAVLANKGLLYSISNKTILIRKADSEIILPVTDRPKYETITGIVADSASYPISNVTVINTSINVAGKSVGTSTRADGVYMVSANKGNILEFTSVGYKKKRIVVGDNSTINVTLAAEVTSLDEIVSIGYGTLRKADLTGAVGSVNVAGSMTARPVTNIPELLAGAVPGLNIAKASGAVGSGASINIRGISTIGGSSGVLVLIDGFPGNINTLNPNDIESVSVLKDAASASIYGSRAANGVLLVTTKSGNKKGKPTVDINSGIGVQNPQFMLDFVGAEDYMKLWDLALQNDGKTPLYGEQGLRDLAEGKYANHKWYREIYKKNSIITNHNISVSGGSDAVVYRVSGGYDFQEGTLPNNSYNKLVFRPDIKIDLSDKVWIHTNLQYTETYIRQPEGGTTLWQSQAARAAPVSPIYAATGQYGVGSSMVNNPIAAVNNGGFNKSAYKELFGILDINYSPIKNWNIKGSFARYSMDQRTTNRVLTYSLYNDNGEVVARQNAVPDITESYGGSYRNTLQLTTDYVHRVNQHQFRLLAGYSQEYFKMEGFNAFRDNLPFSDIHVLDAGAQTNMQNGGNASDVAIQSLFGRINYDYSNRYLLQANVRADGSSRFAKGQQWGIFPSLSLGWNIHNEHFLRTDFISQLKVRGSWGVLGDAEKVGYYATAAVLTYVPGIYGFGGMVVPGAYRGIVIDPSITWEKATQTNLGIDLGILNQKLTAGIDYFFNRRDNILYAPPVPAEFGLNGPVRNLLKLNNRGWEFSLGYQDRARDFSWGGNLNFSFSKNEVIDLGNTGPWIGNAYTNVGGQLNMPYGLIAVGLFRDSADVKSQDQGPNVFPGNIKYADLDGNGVIDGNDRAVLNDKMPVRYGSNIYLRWKNFDFSANMYGMLNNYRYIGAYEGWAFYLSQNARPWAMDSWTPRNPDASYPRLSIQYTANDTRYSSYWLRKAAYLKIQNIQVGYFLPWALLRQTGIVSCRFFISAQNLATITNYPGFDPEGGWYPLSRTFSFGANLKF